MSARGAARPPGHLIGLIAALTIVPLTILLWLGWRLFDQDRLLERQQIQQRVDRGADQVVAALQRAVAATEQQLASGVDRWPDGSVAVTFAEDGIVASPAGRVAWMPRVPATSETPAGVFAHGEDLEFRRRDIEGAIEVYRALARSGDAAVRAGALLRLARNLQNRGRTDEALDAYAKLAGIGEVSIGGIPAALVARYARCKVFDAANRADDLRSEAAELAAALRSGRWLLTAPVYALYTADADRWAGRPYAGPRQTEVLAEAIDALWERRTGTTDGPARESIEAGDRSFVTLWQKSNWSTRALIADRSFVETEWVSPVRPIALDARVVVTLRDGSGHALFGTRLPNAVASATRGAADSGLPFTVMTASVEPPPEARDFAIRRRFLLAGFVLLVVMASVASYAVYRAVSREVAVARLQSDFVSAVSHEFRTPLTSLRQFTDMLRENPALGDERRRVAYEAQSRATDRLMHLVESLLDFGRMQAGARRYRFEPHDCTSLVRAVVDDFRAEVTASGHAIAFAGNGALPIVVDEEALSRAVRNLLDNAVKYSPDPRPIDVAVGPRDADVVISVTDRGIGIPAPELASIFAKFHRGEQARTRGIKGTGIGLAMVDEIVRAHEGRVEVDSEVGRGSTFTIVLPSERSA